MIGYKESKIRKEWYDEECGNILEDKTKQRKNSQEPRKKSPYSFTKRSTNMSTRKRSWLDKKNDKRRHKQQTTNTEKITKQ